jgi:hypothetical protein
MWNDNREDIKGKGGKAIWSEEYSKYLDKRVFGRAVPEPYVSKRNYRQMIEGQVKRWATTVGRDLAIGVENNFFVGEDNAENLRGMLEEFVKFGVKVAGMEGNLDRLVRNAVEREFKAFDFMEAAEASVLFIYSTLFFPPRPWTGGWNPDADLTFGMGHSIKTEADFNRIRSELEWKNP